MILLVIIARFLSPNSGHSQGHFCVFRNGRLDSASPIVRRCFAHGAGGDVGHIWSRTVGSIGKVRKQAIPSDLMLEEIV